MLLINEFLSYSDNTLASRQKIAKEKKALPPSYLFCQIQCDSIIHICKYGRIMVHQKGDRELLSGDGQTVPKTTKFEVSQLPSLLTSQLWWNWDFFLL